KIIKNNITSFSSLIHPEDQCRVRETVDKAFRKNTFFEFEYRIICKDKTEKWVWERGSCVVFENNEPKVLEGFITDITSRKKAEENLTIALDKAKESDRLKTAFLSNMSHEIRTPMNGILGFTNLLKETDITEQKDDYIQIIEKSGIRMLNTINDIIDISRIEAGQVEIIHSEVNVNNELNELYEFFRHEAKSHGIILIYQDTLSDAQANIITDKHKLQGILTNLINNAIKFTEKGSIIIGCSIIEDKIPNELEFYVKDTGIGIPVRRMNAVFNRFEQADIDNPGAFEGSGLGLAITKAYVEMLGGNISVDSIVGTGSTFRFTIPYIIGKPEVTPVKRDSTEETIKSFKNLTVIVAENDVVSTELFKSILSDKFRKLTFTTTGLETIEALKRNPETDIILMDIKMPGMNGYEATQEIRKFNQKVIIIAQTAFGFSN
ncbi:MAG: ATP-binding protein, partial [Bacteroidales bacterium]|nr:ATP-binding protein [Bacteroidales bacterium]